MATVKEHIEQLKKWYKDDDILAVAIWAAEDVRSRAEDLEIKLTDEQVDDVLSYVHYKQDATLGITWDTLDWWIEVVSQEAVNG